MKINIQLNNLSVDVKMFSLCHKETDFQQHSRNCDPLFSQKMFDHAHFGGFLSEGFVWGVYVLEPI